MNIFNDIYISYGYRVPNECERARGTKETYPCTAFQLLARSSFLPRIFSIRSFDDNDNDDGSRVTWRAIIIIIPRTKGRRETCMKWREACQVFRMRSKDMFDRVIECVWRVVVRFGVLGGRTSTETNIIRVSGVSG